MLPSETMIWQPEFTDKTLSRKPGAVHSFPFPLPAFSIVRTCEQKKKIRLHFKPKVNVNGAISYTLESDYDVFLGELSWQACSPGQNDGYWFINAEQHRHESIKSCPFNFKGAEMLFAILCN